MRAFLVALTVATLTWTQARGDEGKDSELRAELQKLQGLWQTVPGGIEHDGGSQVVRNPAPDGPCFFVYEDRLIWLDADGKPTGEKAKITLDVNADPKRVTITPVGEEEGKAIHGIYEATGSGLRIHVGIDGGPAPKQFLDMNKPVEGVDGREWLVSRKKLKNE